MTSLAPPPAYQQIQEHVDGYAHAFDRLRQAVGQVIVGQHDLVRKMLIALLAKGHVLLEGMPGLAKTLTVQTLAQTLSLDFSRIQFTPDLLPADLIGTQIYHPKDQTFYPKTGPVFANIVLADEINRAPAKVQSALLEAMQEKQVTLGDTTYSLPRPFWVMATQNPVDQEGTYVLPEAQVDRFMLKINLDYPSREEERMIMDRMIEANPNPPQAVFTAEQIQAAQNLLRQMYVADPIKDYIVDIIRATRPQTSMTSSDNLRQVQSYIDFGVSPRATLSLNLAARAQALLEHRCYVIPDDIKSVALDILRHRITLSYRAEADGLTADTLIQRLLAAVPAP
ncbi:MAG: MoxR family ATPase [Deltaproteobacteria bacterium]|nr:MAG: MoxR family ATPase [Deltaproteobacteria bacterium]